MLAAAHRLRVAAEDTYFSIPEVDLGIPLAWGGIPRLVREIGPALTRELVLTCRPSGDTGGQVVTVGSTDWVFGLAGDEQVARVTANALDRLGAGR